MMTPLPKAYSYIRFSTPEQSQGDSLRRQLEASRKYAEKKGFALDETLTVKDLGVSAFSGANVTKGSLGKFLQAVEDGTIPIGSILIVESLDRLSRDQILTALSLFTSIIEQGITIVTLADGQEYNKETVNSDFSKLIISITSMARAHEESAMKSKRVSESWANKRKNIGKRKLTSKCPNWLKLNKKTQTFEKIPERVKIVKRIFKLHEDGHGAYTICSIFNKEGVKTLGRSKSWRSSNVKKILHSKATIGQFQPHTAQIIDGKKVRQKVGDPIIDYYPRIISDETFYATQDRLSKKFKRGGRRGFMRNLFTHLVHCGYCGAKTHFQICASRHYLRCDQSKANRGCDARYFQYTEFEKIFLNEVQELDVSSIIPSGNGRAKKIKSAQQSLDAARGQLADIELRIKNYDKAIDTATSDAIIERFVKKLTDAEGEKKDAEKRLSQAQMAYHAATSETASTDEQLKGLKDLIRKLGNTEGEALIQLRQKLKNAIAGLVERIEIYSDGLGDRILHGDVFSGPKFQSVNDLIAHLENVGDDPDIFGPGDYNRIIGELTSYQARNTGKANRAFLVRFKAGGWRFVKRDGDGWTNVIATMAALNSVIDNGIK